MIDDMLKSVDIEEYNLIDVNTIDVSTLGQCRVGMAFGRICGRIVREKVDRLLVFPATTSLYKDPNNKEDRKKAQLMLGTVSDMLEDPTEPDDVQETNVLGTFLQTKTGSAYVSNMTHQEAEHTADICLSTNDLEYIDEIRNVFQADQISLIVKK